MDKLTKRIELLEAILENAKERQVIELRTVMDDLKTTQGVMLTISNEEELYYEVMRLVKRRIKILKNELKIQNRRAKE